MLLAILYYVRPYLVFSMTSIYHSLCTSFFKSGGRTMAHNWADVALQWRHNGLNGVSNHQPHHFLLNRLFGRRSEKTSKFRVTGLCAGPVTRKMFPFDDAIMRLSDVGSLMSKQSDQQCVDRWHFQSILFTQLYKWVSQMRAILAARCEPGHASRCAI